MSKVIAVIDKPKSCEVCPCFEGGMFNGVCRLEKQTKSNTEKTIPKWCPLREVPQKQSLNGTLSEFQMGARSGYNLCIDEIMKGSDENEIDRCGCVD